MREILRGATHSVLCRHVADAIRSAGYDLIADLTCGEGSFFNFFPVGENLYGCDLDMKACKVARFLYPKANVTQGDIRAYRLEQRFNYVVGNPSFHMCWQTESGGESPGSLTITITARTSPPG